MKRVAFDLDGVLVNTFGVFCNVLEESHPGIKVLKNNEFRISTDPPITDKEIWRIFYEAFPRIDDIKIFPGASSLLRWVFDETLEPVKIVTSRPRKFQLETLFLIKKFYDGPLHLQMVDDSSEKINYLKRQDIFVEDRRKTAIQLAAAGKTVLLIDRYYNRLTYYVPGIIVVNDLFEVYEYLRGNHVIRNEMHGLQRDGNLYDGAAVDPDRGRKVCPAYQYDI